jgi:ubiquinone/menaquinone biosynthesis C-methylase UbiE
MHTPFPDNSFDVVTAISVIEHGFNPDLLLKEMSRIVKKGGHFIGSTDYWSEKIDVKNQKIFGMDWMIFSEKEIKEFIEMAKKYSFQIVGDKDFSVKEKPVELLNQNYTFLWFAFQKVGNGER